MSKTDRTKPYRVIAEEYKVLYPRRTDQRFGLDRYWVGETNCSCRSCSRNNQQDRKQRTRKERQQVKRNIARRPEDA